MFELYTDGACKGNPGPGGFGVVVLKNGNVLAKLNHGYQKTTNNRMEYRACIAGLEYILEKGEKTVDLYTDSQYVLNSMTKWAFKWQKFNWFKEKAQKNPVKNADLAQKLFFLTHNAGVKVNWHWVRGHAGNTYNEMADELAVQASFGSNLDEDTEIIQTKPQNSLF